jgi:glutamate-1-semialdehyde 2,1-aminomutase
MELVAPAGPVYQAGTLSGNPLAMTAGIETLRALAEPGVWDDVAGACERLFDGIGDGAADAGVAGQPTRAGTMCGFFFTQSPIRSWEEARRVDTDRFAAFHRAMLERGVYLPPSQYESWFLSSAHEDAEIDATIAAAREAFASLA